MDKVKFKQSRAIIAWPAIMLSVLLFLFILTRNTTYPGYNLCLNGEASLSGAKVYIDGVFVGNLKNNNENNLSGSCLCLNVKNGKHNLEVKKLGYGSLSKDFVMKNEAYIGINLKPDDN